MNRAFTLIELLVVITIIVVLLALLTPALDRALYQAELVQCGARLDAVATGAQLYALSHNRYYPTRDALKVNPDEAQAYKLAHAEEYDDRPRLEGFIDLKTLNCPLAGDLDLSLPATEDSNKRVFSSYDLWFGFGYTGNGQMLKLGQKISFGRTFNVIATDREVTINVNAQFHSSHPDNSGFLTNNIRQKQKNSDVIGQQLGEAWTKARWEGGDRGTLDFNYATADGAVYRLTGLVKEDERLTGIPEYANGRDYPAQAIQLPLD